MNRKLKRMAYRHDTARIPKLVLQDRDFSQIDLFFIKLRKGEVETIGGHIVMTAQDGEVYRVIPALEGWIEYWQRMAVPAMAWIGIRMQQVEDVCQATD